MEMAATKEKEVLVTGFGGQGIVLTGAILGKAATIHDRVHATMTQSYGPEARGGSCSSQVIISHEPIPYPYVEEPQALICMSQEGYDKNIGALVESGLLVWDTDLVETGELDPEMIALPRIRLGNLRLDSLQVAVLDFTLPGKTLGVLSVKLFEEYLTTFDYPNSTLILEKAHLEVGEDRHVMSYVTEPIVTIDVIIAEETVTMHLDTGSPAYITVSDRTAELLNFGNGLEYSKTARIPGKEVILRKGVLQGQILIAGNVITNPELEVGTFFGDIGNIGYGYLKDKILTLDHSVVYCA